MVRMRISMHALRSIEHKGGLDAFLLDAKAIQLTPELRRLKKRIERAKAA
jgi:large subunit ribosomal protein L28